MKNLSQFGDPHFYHPLLIRGGGIHPPPPFPMPVFSENQSMPFRVKRQNVNCMPQEKNVLCLATFFICFYFVVIVIDENLLDRRMRNQDFRVWVFFLCYTWSSQLLMKFLASTIKNSSQSHIKNKFDLSCDNLMSSELKP